MVLIRVPIHERTLVAYGWQTKRSASMRCWTAVHRARQAHHPQAVPARTFPVKIEVANTLESVLKSGMFARVRLRTGTAQRVCCA